MLLLAEGAEAAKAAPSAGLRLTPIASVRGGVVGDGSRYVVSRVDVRDFSVWDLKRGTKRRLGLPSGCGLLSIGAGSVLYRCADNVFLAIDLASFRVTMLPPLMTPSAPGESALGSAYTSIGKRWARGEVFPDTPRGYPIPVYEELATGRMVTIPSRSGYRIDLDAQYPAVPCARASGCPTGSTRSIPPRGLRRRTSPASWSGRGRPTSPSTRWPTAWGRCCCSAAGGLRASSATASAWSARRRWSTIGRSPGRSSRRGAGPAGLAARRGPRHAAERFGRVARASGRAHARAAPDVRRRRPQAAPRHDDPNAAMSP